MAGKRQKAVEDLQNKRGGRGENRVVIPEVITPGRWPPAPKGLGNHARSVWARLGKAVVSGAVDLNADWHVLHRYIWDVNFWAALTQKAANVEPVVKGSTGQPTMHPLIRAIGDLESRLDRLEELLGFNPLARFRLGIASLEEQQKQKDLNARAAPDNKPRKMGGR
jgi:P27 family predicted phage terminase small subunit